jgi:hypothetical protein
MADQGLIARCVPWELTALQAASTENPMSLGSAAYAKKALFVLLVITILCLRYLGITGFL